MGALAGAFAIEGNPAAASERKRATSNDGLLAASSTFGWRRSRLVWISPDIPMKWRFFIGAAILGTMLVLSAGAPPVPVALGVALVLLLNLYNARKV
jgi:hypothetical protein